MSQEARAALETKLLGLLEVYDIETDEEDAFVTDEDDTFDN
jgi:hypothetical protein